MVVNEPANKIMREIIVLERAFFYSGSSEERMEVLKATKDKLNGRVYKHLFFANDFGYF
jgi:hypothetical protein